MFLSLILMKPFSFCQNQLFVNRKDSFILKYCTLVGLSLLQCSVRQLPTPIICLNIWQKLVPKSQTYNNLWLQQRWENLTCLSNYLFTEVIGVFFWIIANVINSDIFIYSHIFSLRGSWSQFFLRKVPQIFSVTSTTLILVLIYT